MNLKKTLTSFISLFLFSSIVCAQTVNLYEQPDPTSKVVGKAETASGIIPIFKPKTGDWIKVADPKNGNVGWVKQTEINNANETRTFQTIQYKGKPTTPNDAEVKAMIQQIKVQQELFQKSFQNMFEDVNKVFENEFKQIKNNNTPAQKP